MAAPSYMTALLAALALCTARCWAISAPSSQHYMGGANQLPFEFRAATLDDIPLAVRTQPIDLPTTSNGHRDPYSAGSATSSSEGSPPSAALDAALALARGRNRSQTPIQGNGPAHDDEEW